MPAPQPRHLPRWTSQESTGMFSAAPMRCPQDGQRERGASKSKRSVWGAGSPRNSAAWLAQSCSIMIGTRWMTTFRKLPTSRPMRAAAAIAKGGDWARRSSIGRGRAGQGGARIAAAGTRRPLARSDHLAELEDGQVHGHDQAPDQGAEDDHDEWFQQAREALDGVVDLALVDVGRLAEHRVDRARLLADRGHLQDHVREHARVLHCDGQAGTGRNLLLD